MNIKRVALAVGPLGQIVDRGSYEWHIDTITSAFLILFVQFSSFYGETVSRTP